MQLIREDQGERQQQDSDKACNHLRGCIQLRVGAGEGRQAKNCIQLLHHGCNFIKRKLLPINCFNILNNLINNETQSINTKNLENR